MMRTLFYLFLIVALIPTENALSKMLSVKVEKVQLMSRPDKNSQVTWEYGKGFPVNILSTHGQWVKVEDFEHDSGWVLKNLLSDQPTVIVKANRKTEGKIDIHVGPGKEYQTIGQAFYGVVFRKLEHKNGWMKVLHDSGLTGWVKDSFLWGYEYP
jgi:SH3-like domain-containing protein